MEQWKPVIGFEEAYEVSNFGRVRSLTRTVPARNGMRDVPSIIRKQGESTAGYPQVHLSFQGSDKVLPVHKMVASAFLVSVAGKDQINHKDGNKKNNRVENLEYCSCLENLTHALATGLRVNPKGSKNGMSKLTESQVSEIRSRLESGEGQTCISKKYGVTNKLIHLIAKRRVWQHV